jgi:hypothetical protein
MNSELEQARQDRDEARRAFVEETHKANKHTLKAKAARARWVLANDEVRAQERDEMAFPSMV